MRSATWRRKGGLVAMGACEAEKLVMKGVARAGFSCAGAGDSTCCTQGHEPGWLPRGADPEAPREPSSRVRFAGRNAWRALNK